MSVLRALAAVICVVILVASGFWVLTGMNLDDNGVPTIPGFPKVPGLTNTDTDGDGVPDKEDAFPYDPKEWLDSDGDGIGDNSDPYPFDKDNDGFMDDDLVPDQDAGVTIILTAFVVKDARYAASQSPPRGGYSQGQQTAVSTTAYFIVTVDGQEQDRVQADAGLWTVAAGILVDASLELRYDVADNARAHEIEIAMWDEYQGAAEQLDLDGTGDGMTLKFTLDIVTGEVSGDGASGGILTGDGSLDGISGERNGYLRAVASLGEINGYKMFTWTFSTSTKAQVQASMWLSIPDASYAEYQNKALDRSRHMDYGEARDYVTPDDKVIQEAAAKLRAEADARGLSALDTANMVLAFCQTIPYVTDIDSKGLAEYWKFPVETLYEGNGDCEDTSFLFASLMEAMGYDAAILFFDDHMAAGLGSSPDHVQFTAYGTHYKKTVDGVTVQYYYCETTSTGFSIGDLPGDMEGAQAHVILL